MNEETTKLVLSQHRDKIDEHDNIIKELVFSVEQLVKTQSDTNIELKKISTFLAKQAVFSTKLEDLQANLTESFMRVHKRIDELNKIQTSTSGCNSVKLANKDIAHLTEDIDRLVATVGSVNTKVDAVVLKQEESLSSSTIRWILGFVIVYTIGFGVFVTSSLSSMNNNISNIAIKTSTFDRDLSRIEHWIGFMENKNDRKRNK